jgi:SAM-dependent methyltransferase
MALPPDDQARAELQRIAQRTLAHYNQNAEAFWQGTRDHDVRQNIAALLRHINSPAPFTVLDFGCGPGRDLHTFTALGHHAVGLEGSPTLAEMARAHSGCEVLEQSFLALDLPDAHFDGVFANASLFHVPRRALPGVLRQLWATLKPGGVLFSSNPRGDGQEGWRGERYGVHHRWPEWRAAVEGAGFAYLEHYFRPTDAPPEQQLWLASVWRRPA